MENTEVEVKEEKEKTSKIKTILTIVGNVLFYAVIILLFLFSLMNINAGNGETSFPNLFGRGMLTVTTNSMERNPEPYYQRPEWEDYDIQNIDAGDLVYVKVFKESDFSSLKIGDVITFVDESLAGMDTMLNTHRIVYISLDEKYVICQGDYVVTQNQTDAYAFDLYDPFCAKNSQLNDQKLTQTVSLSNIKGVVTGVSRGAGAVLTNIRSNWLFYFVIPVAVILIIEIFFVFKNILDMRNEKNKAALATDKETMMADLEAEKEKMRQELLAEMRAQMAAEAKASAPAEPELEVKEEPQPETTIEPVQEEVSEVSPTEESEPEVKAEETTEPEEETKPVAEEPASAVVEEEKEEVTDVTTTEDVQDTKEEVPETKEE